MFLFLLFPALTGFAQTDINTPPTLAPAYGEMPPTFLEQHQMTVIITCFAFLAFVFLFVKTMLRPESPKILPPETVVRQALAKFQREPENGNILSAVSQILRRYLSESFNLPDQELTTSEFCAAIEANQQMGVDLAQAISSFLHECDERKFSATPFAAPFNAVASALDLISLAEKRQFSVGRTSSPHQLPVK